MIHLPAQDFNIQARLDEVRARIQSARPNVLGSALQNMQTTSAGGLMASMQNRMRARMANRPMLQQAMQGRLISGRAGQTAGVAMARQAGFPSDRMVRTPATPSGYQLTT